MDLLYIVGIFVGIILLLGSIMFYNDSKNHFNVFNMGWFSGFILYNIGNIMGGHTTPASSISMILLLLFLGLGNFLIYEFNGKTLLNLFASGFSLSIGFMFIVQGWMFS